MNIVKSEIKTIEGREYQYTEYDAFLPDGTPYSETKYIQTQLEIQQEIAEQQKQLRISELTTLIEKKKLRGYDYSVELAELELLDPIL